MLIAWIEERARNMWREVSTYWGIFATAASVIAPQYAQFDPRIAWIGAIAGIYLMARKDKAGGQPSA